MFSYEQLGYNKEEVDLCISKLKAELMQKKLSLLDSEQKVLDLKQKQDELESKEKKIMSAVKTLEQAQKEQEQGAKNLYALKAKQNKIIYSKICETFEMLKSRYPQINLDSEMMSRIIELEELIENAKQDVSGRANKVNSDNDSMRALLSKMQEYKRQQEGARVVRIERKSLGNNLHAESVDEFLAEKPQTTELYKNVEIQSSGFDLKEAVNPKDDLDQIMKAFDFFND